MGRRVKLFDKVGEFGDSSIAFKAPTGKYFSSEKAYKDWANNRDYRQKCINKIYELLEYESYQMLPSLFYKRLSEWTGYGFETVYRAIGRAEQSICWVLNTKDFSSEVGKLMYITKIIEGQLNDAKKEVSQMHKLHGNTSSQIIIDEYATEKIDLIGRKQTTKDISRFLEEED